MKKILILASNPRADLDLGYEIHALKKIIEERKNLQEFDVIIDDAISPSKIQKLFLEHEPRIVHFCGHGSGTNGLVFVDSAGKEQLVSTQALSNLFQEFNDTIECVLLNACYSEIQANEIAKHINYAIGMNQAIADDAAIFFAKGFYQALGKGKQIKQCFRLGKNAIELELSKLSGKTRKFEVLDEECELIPEHLKPTIKIKTDLTRFQEDIAREKYIQDNQRDFNLGRREQPTLSKKEYRFRQILLNKVKDSWIKGVLENSVHTKALLELKIEGKANLVHNPFSHYQELPVDPNASYEWLNATDIFEQMGDGRTLLILGEPGSGKTIALLRLAKRFIEKAENNLSLPIPVVFNLSSWASKRKSITEWLVIELKDKYQVSKALAKKWIEQEQLLLLLDGLDEVQKEHRNNCINALNKFLNSHGQTETAVCCRFQDYQTLSKKLRLRNAIYIQSLTTEHIDWYLKDSGDTLLGLKTLLRNDPEIEDFAKTPLILSIMSLTYQNHSAKEILEQLSSSTSRYKTLFDSYIKRIFERRSITEKYKKRVVCKQLIWVSKYLTKSAKTTFFIENIQPYSLNHFIGKVIYLLILNSLYSLFLLLWYCAGVSLFLPFDILSDGLNFYFHFFLYTFYLFFVFFWSYKTLSDRESIQPFEKIKFSKKRFLKQWEGMNKGLNKYIVKLTVLLIFALLITLKINLELSLFLFVFTITLTPSILAHLLGSAIFAFSETIEEVDKTQYPNQMIIISTLTGIKFFILGFSCLVLLIFLIGQFVDNLYGSLDFESLEQEYKNIQTLKWVIWMIGPYVAWISFNATIQHLCLRISLLLTRKIPFNYTNFLDYATKNIFMYKVGGGYIFIHRMLMEHFANMKLEQ
ncbi:MAG: NACHT domain-containing protein [Cyanobacteria bacterium P01_A01_bin.83]